MSECTETVRVVPGPTGNAGTNGADGTDGVNAFTTVTQAFNMPLVGASETVFVEDSTWMSPLGGAISGQVVHVQFAGHFAVEVLPTSQSVTLLNLGYPGNLAPGPLVPVGSKVSPAGLQGAAGVDGATPTLDDITPTTTKGDVIVDNGAGTIRLAVGADGTRFMADSAQAAGVAWAKVDLADGNEVTGITPVANGGTGSANAAGAATNLSVLPLSGGTLVGDTRISKNLVKFWLNDTAAAADEGKGYFCQNSSSFQYVVANDAEGVNTPVFTIERTGVVPDYMAINTLLRAASTAEFQQITRYSMAINTALVAGNNNDCAFGNVTFLKLKAGPVGAFTITGIAGGADGRRLIIYNATGQAMTIDHENALSAASNRITCMDGAAFVTTVAGTAELIYDAESLRWLLISKEA